MSHEICKLHPKTRCRAILNWGNISILQFTLDTLFLKIYLPIPPQENEKKSVGWSLKYKFLQMCDVQNEGARIIKLIMSYIWKGLKAKRLKEFDSNQYDR